MFGRFYNQPYLQPTFDTTTPHTGVLPRRAESSLTDIHRR
jgi:hypothetical protein